MMTAQLGSIAVDDMLIRYAFLGFSGVRIVGKVRGREQVLPAQFSSRVRPFDRQSIGHPYPAGSDEEDPVGGVW